jgi:polyferredoxin
MRKEYAKITIVCLLSGIVGFAGSTILPPFDPIWPLIGFSLPGLISAIWILVLKIRRRIRGEERHE